MGEMINQAQYNMKQFITKAFIILIICLSFNVNKTIAQSDMPNSVNWEPEVWSGYITSINLNNKWSIWNDWHFIPNTFFVTRHGLTYSPIKDLSFTGGYAWLTTATSTNRSLVRPEHRPWGQIEWRKAVSKNSSFRLRYRYDGRIRNVVRDGQVIPDEYIFYSRHRLMASYRYNIFRFDNGNRLHGNILNEYLYNQGRQVQNGLDQNRTYLMLGLSIPNLTILAGYHQRQIPQNSGWLIRHGFTCWLIHSIQKSKNRPEPVP
jgi:hypothetical protein